MARRRPRGLTCGIVLLVTVCALMLAPIAHAAFPGKNGKIAFFFDSGTGFGNGDIYSMDPDGTNRTRLTSGETQETLPAWSPDGTKIAFVRGTQIWTMNADGTNQTQLTSGAPGDRDPSWSPDGAKIAFDTARDSQRAGPTSYDIYTMNADGTNQTLLTNHAPYDDASPAWFPNGTKIAFASDRDGNGEIYTMNADGTNQTRLTNNTASDGQPNWSPDGSKIAFVSARDANSEIYTMNADGTNQTRLTNNPASDTAPTFSPDGTEIVFDTARNNDPYKDIYVMNEDGTNQTALTNDGLDYDPDWQPLPINSYPRPKGATPLRVSLVVAYKECTAATADRQHGSPLSAPSCSLWNYPTNPEPQASKYLTVGTGDTWPGTVPKSVGSVRLDVKPAPPEDVKIATSITDVRCNNFNTTGFCDTANSDNPRVPDYSGELQLSTSLRITDKDNTPAPDGTTQAATVADIPFSATVPCAATSDTTIGSTCALTTTANALVPGQVIGNMRSIWQLDQVELYDGGADGQASTSADNTLFMDEGVFVP